jgi:hypothetical protein
MLGSIWSLGQEAVQPLIERRVRFLFAGDPQFPSSVARMPEEMRPPWLFVAGDLELLERPSLAIVGTRDPTEDGEFLARYAVSCAKETEAPVVSGLAYGIDRLVHEWCLHISLPTISVLGTGILSTYPAKHAPLSDAILAAGGDRIPPDTGAISPAICLEESATGCTRPRHDPGRMEKDIRHGAYGQVLAQARPSGAGAAIGWRAGTSRGWRSRSEICRPE